MTCPFSGPKTSSSCLSSSSATLRELARRTRRRPRARPSRTPPTNSTLAPACSRSSTRAPISIASRDHAARDRRPPPRARARASTAVGSSTTRPSTITRLARTVTRGVAEGSGGFHGERRRLCPRPDRTAAYAQRNHSALTLGRSGRDDRLSASESRAPQALVAARLLALSCRSRTSAAAAVAAARSAGSRAGRSRARRRRCRPCAGGSGSPAGPSTRCGARSARPPGRRSGPAARCAQRRWPSPEQSNRLHAPRRQVTRGPRSAAAPPAPPRRRRRGRPRRARARADERDHRLDGVGLALEHGLGGAVAAVARPAGDAAPVAPRAAPSRGRTRPGRARPPAPAAERGSRSCGVP